MKFTMKKTTALTAHPKTTGRMPNQAKTVGCKRTSAPDTESESIHGYNRNTEHGDQHGDHCGDYVAGSCVGNDFFVRKLLSAVFQVEVVHDHG